MSAWEASEIKIPPKRGMGVLPPDAHPERFGFGYRLCSRVDAGVKPTCACKRACSGLSLLTWQYSRYENGVSPHHVAAQCCCSLKRKNPALCRIRLSERPAPAKLIQFCSQTEELRVGKKGF